MTTAKHRSWVNAGWDAPPNVKAGTTLRTGGSSSGPFDSLNLGMHVGDDVNAVPENRAFLRKELALPSEPVWLDQTHSTHVIEISDEANETTADGSATEQSGVVCCVMTADCLPLFLTNQAGTRVAVLHAGWRGMADGIIEAGLELFAESAGKVIAHAGPCISVEHFEVGLEVRDQLGGSDAAYNFEADPGKCYADLHQLSRERLAACGVDDFTHSSLCTYADSEQFFSYRRDGQCGRMASLIWMVAD